MARPALTAKGITYLATRVVPITELTDYPGNARVHDERALDDSLGAHGQVGAIKARQLPDGTVQILGGHGTRDTIARRGGTHARVELYRIDDDEQARKVVLALNATTDRATYDQERLLALLAETDAEGTGIDPAEYERLLARIPDGSSGSMPDEQDTTPPADPVTRPGDVWTLGVHRLICGDATDPAVHTAVLDGARVGSIITDPPYGMRLDTDWSSAQGSLKSLGRRRGTRGNTYAPVIGDHEDYDPRPVLGMYPSVREQFWWGADYYAERIPDRNDGAWLVWDKRKETQADAIGSEFELCWSRARHKRRMLRHDWFGFLASGDNAADARRRVHPTQKPVTLIEDIIRQWIPEGATILDPYGGSGTTLLAAHRTGRRAYLIELDPGYCDVICRRWQELTGRNPTRDGAPHDFALIPDETELGAE